VEEAPVQDDVDGGATSSPTVAALHRRASDARVRGAFDEAAELYREAAAAAATTQERLWSMMREAYCRMTAEDAGGAEVLARTVADEARTEWYYPELADALSLLVDRSMVGGDYAAATQLLAEALYVMEKVPNEPANFLVVHNMAVTYSRCQFPVPALELYDRALRLAEHDGDRTFAYANMTAAAHMAMVHAADEEAAQRFLHDGMYAATAALDPEAETEVVARAIALAHRSVLLNRLGHYEAALRDAVAARALAEEHGLSEERVVAIGGEAVARWRLHADPSVLDLVTVARAVARELNLSAYVQATTPVGVEILWSQGRYDEARALLTDELGALTADLRSEREARWANVRLGVSLRTTEALSEADPLTGLPNRRYLAHWLPEVLDAEMPVCVAVLDLDGFKQVNDEHSYAHGDRVLQELAGILQRVCRRGDAVVRLGGDEFVIVLRDTSPNDARTALDRVRQMIAVRRWEGLPPSLTLTASIGVAAGSGAVDAPRVLTSATEAMQAAKREGRDRIVVR